MLVFTGKITGFTLAVGAFERGVCVTSAVINAAINGVIGTMKYLKAEGGRLAAGITVEVGMVCACGVGMRGG